MNIYINTIQGNEANARPDGNDTTSYFGVIDLVATYQLTPRWLLSLWAMQGSLKGEFQGGAYTNEMIHWSGVNLYASYKFSDVFSLGTRLEYFDNLSGARALLTNGQGTDVQTYTLTGNVYLADGKLNLKPEVRLDNFKKMAGPNGEVLPQQFQDAKGNFNTNQQTTVGMAVIYKF